MDQVISTKRYDLEERTKTFALNVRQFVKKLPRSIAALEDGKQLIRSSGSVGANYIEANEALSKKDFLLRIKICRKEAKESAYWLNLLRHEIEKTELNVVTQGLILEATELTMIFSAIMRKTDAKV
jgi:four helix bundle protein